MDVLLRMPAISLVAFIGEAILAVLIAVAFFRARSHQGTQHHWLLLGIYIADIAVFKVIMYLRGFSGDFGSPFEGIILYHMVLSWIWTIGGLLVIYWGFKYRVVRKGHMFMPPRGRRHRLIGYVAIGGWYLTFFFGLSIFVRFYI